MKNFLIELKNGKMLIVMSGSNAVKILPLNIDMNEKIIIFCRDYSKYSSLKNKYSNVVDVCDKHKRLEDSIYREFPSLKSNLFVNRTLRSTRYFSPFENEDDNDDNPYFLYMSFLEALKQMQSTEQSKEFMSNKCQEYYRISGSYFEDINEYRRKYTSDKAIDWYVKPSFIFQLVNHAFKTDDIILMYIFRSYVVDLCQQLDRAHKKQKRKRQKCFIVYRGQSQMSTDELDK